MAQVTPMARRIIGGRPDSPAGRPDESGGPSETGPADRRPAPDGAGNPHIDDWPWTNDAIPGSHEPASGHGPANDARPGKVPSTSRAPMTTRIRRSAMTPRSVGTPRSATTPRSLATMSRAKSGQAASGQAATRPDRTLRIREPVRCHGQKRHRCMPPGPAALKNLEPVGGGYLDLRLPWLTLHPRWSRTRLPDPHRADHLRPGQLPRPPRSGRPGRGMAGRHH